MQEGEAVACLVCYTTAISKAKCRCKLRQLATQECCNDAKASISYKQQGDQCIPYHNHRGMSGVSWEQV